MQDKVIEFINRRFSKDCDWTTGNCYYFALILSDRFPGGEVYYDVIDGHFIYFYEGFYYDWTGKIEPDGVLLKWREFDKYDSLQKKQIIKYCLM